VNNLSITGIISLFVVGGIAGAGYYYRDNIKEAFGEKKSQEEKDYDFTRKQKEDLEWDESGWNPDNWKWPWDESDSNYTKTNPKENAKQKENDKKEIPITNSSNKTYNKGNRRFN